MSRPRHYVVGCKVVDILGGSPTLESCLIVASILYICLAGIFIVGSIPDVHNHPLRSNYGSRTFTIRVYEYQLSVKLYVKRLLAV